MGKDTLNHNKSSSRSNKPYDVSNSFVRKVASRVSGYFGGLFSTPEANSQGTSDGSTRTTPDPELTDSDTPSLTRVGTLDYASPVSNITTDLSKKFKTKIASPEPTAGPSRLQTRYELENFKFGINVADRGTLSTGSSGLHKFSRLDKDSDSVGTFDYTSPVSNITTDLSKIASPEPTAGPSRLQTRYEFENFKFGINVADRGTLSTGSSGLHKFSRLDKDTDSPLPNYSGLHPSLGKYESPVSREESNRSSAGPCTFGMKFKIDSSESRETPRSSVTGSNKHARLDPEAKCSSVGDDHSESSESTSGCSSLVPQADRLSQSAFVLSSRRKSLALDDKLSYARQLKQSRNSLYLNRSIPVHAETPRPSRTPSFDVSAYGKPILNKSVRETMLSSPFYTGQTTYGGAAAARRSSLGTPSTRNQIAVKPAAQPQEGINMSHTARRILAALEEFSTPLNDVKRIPTPAPPFAVKRRNIEQSSSERSKRPALTVPTVADMLKMRRLEQIQDSTAMAREIATAPRKLSPPRRSGKIVTKMKNRDKTCDDPPPPPPDLPKVSLQFTSLPKFDLPLLNTVQPTVVASSPSFTFSSPSVPTTASNSFQSAPPLLPNQFNFSPPMPITEWLQPNKPTHSSVVTPESVGKLKRKSEAPENNGTPVPAAALVEGSVMDILGKSVSKPFKPTECSKAESVTSSTALKGFGSKFKPLTGSWTCDTCLIVNKPDVSICVACEAKRVEKVSSKNNFPTCFFPLVPPTPFPPPSTFQNNETPLLNSKPLLGFGDKFKPVPGSWSCEDCMVTNKADSTKCVSCSASKPGLAAKDVKKTGPWKCVVCLISNDENCEKCSSCETSRPNKPLTAEPKFDFGLPSVAFKFGIDKAGVDVVKTTASNGPISTAFAKATNAPVSTGTFTFGIPKDMPELEKKNVNSVPMEAGSSPTKVNPESTSVKSSFLPPATTSNTGFTFGNTTTSTTLPAQPVKKFQGFGLNGPLSNNIADDKSASSFSGTTTITSATSSTTITNDTVTSKLTTEQPTTLPFKFGSEPGKPLPGVFTFGAKTNVESKPFPSSSQSPKIEFNFGNLKPKPISNSTNNSQTAPTTSGLSVPAFGTSAQTTVPDFGVSSSIPFTTAPKTHASNATFVFGTAPATPTPAFGSLSSTTPAFGSLSSTTPTQTFGASSTTPTPAFGSSLTTITPSFGASSTTSTPGFGALSTTTTPAFGTLNPPPSFENSIISTPTFGTNSPAASMFGSATPQVTTATFGATGTPAFGVASNVTAPTFGASTAAPTSIFGTAPASTTPAFGSSGVSSTPMFGSSSTPTFGVTSSTPFGNPSTGPSTQFGTVPAQPAFGQTPAPQAFPSSSPFQFGANNPGAANSLSLSVPSSFNFTGGQTPTFSADPRSGPEPKRRIIRALRRSHK